MPQKKQMSRHKNPRFPLSENKKIVGVSVHVCVSEFVRERVSERDGI